MTVLPGHTIFQLCGCFPQFRLGPLYDGRAPAGEKTLPSIPCCKGQPTVSKRGNSKKEYGVVRINECFGIKGFLGVFLLGRQQRFVILTIPPWLCGRNP